MKEINSRMSPPSAAGENPSASEPDRDPPGSEPDRDSRWLQTLSEPELDLMISLKELAVTQIAAHPGLSRRLHLRTLRALGIVLLEHFKEQSSSGMDRLALPLRDPEVQLQSKSNGVDKKRRQLPHGSGEDSTSSSKKRKMER